MSEKATATVKTTEIKKATSSSQSQRTERSEVTNSPMDQILFLQRTVGNQAVQRLFKSGHLQAKLRKGQPGDIYEKKADRVANRMNERDSFNSFSHSYPLGTMGVHRDLTPPKAEDSPKEAGPSSASKAEPHPTSIEKTEIDKHKLHFGAHYKHTLKSSGGSLEGIDVTEKVTKIRDDFETGLPDLGLGKIKTKINKKGEIGDRIWISFGAIAPSVESLRKKKKQGEALLGKKQDHQELHYWDNKEPSGWKKFAGVKIGWHLYDLPGLVVATIDNDVQAESEEFTPFRSGSEGKRQLHYILQPKLAI